MGIDAKGLVTIAVEDRNNGLDVYWDDRRAQWHGPLGV